MTLSMPNDEGFMNCWRILEAFLHSPVDVSKSSRYRSASFLTRERAGQGVVDPHARHLDCTVSRRRDVSDEVCWVKKGDDRAIKAIGAEKRSNLYSGEKNKANAVEW